MTVLLEQVIMRVESSGFTGAVRFEAGLFNNLPGWIGRTTDEIGRINKCNGDSAAMIACTSWGLFQILGATLYGDLAYPGPIASFWIDSEQQITQFRKLVTKWGFDPMNFDFTDDALVDAFAKRYNGPGNPTEYGTKMVMTYHALNV